MKILFATPYKGFYPRERFPEAKVDDLILLTDEDIKFLIEHRGLAIDIDDDLYMVVDYATEDYVIGDIAHFHEVAGFGMAEYDSPFR